MNLIEKFENMPVQDVGTFNSIFKTTPIMGYDFSTEVQIYELKADNKRRIQVGNEVVFIDLTQRKSIKEEKRVTFVRPRGKLNKSKKISRELPKVYKILKPTEFMIYSAIKEVGEVSGIEELSRKISITNKTIIANLPRLIQLGLVKKQYVSCEGETGSFNKLTVDTSVNLV
jgi:hypothetical protein